MSSDPFGVYAERKEALAEWRKVAKGPLAELRLRVAGWVLGERLWHALLRTIKAMADVEAKRG